MFDRYSSHNASFGAPAGFAFAVTPDDSNDLEEVTRGLFIGTAGNVKLTLRLGGTVTLKNIPAGTLLPLRVTRIFATGTSAADLVGLS